EDATVPPSLGTAIGHRLDALSPATREVLRAAAVLVPGSTLPELSTVLGTPVVALWPSVDESLRANLLAGTGDQLAFRHELIRRVLAEQVPPQARRSLWASAARALASAGAPVERVAGYLVAGADLDAGMARWLVSSSGALIARAPDLAVELLGRLIG